MAYADYRHCDLCDRKTFYDANLDYDEGAIDRPAFRRAGVAIPGGLALHNLGDWAVLCDECSKTHVTQIVRVVGPDDSVPNTPPAAPGTP